MKLKFCLFLSAFLLMECSVNKNYNYDLKIKITGGMSEVFDLEKGRLEIFNTMTKNVLIKFNLTKEERNAINKKYYQLNLDKLINSKSDSAFMRIPNECTFMPQIYTTLSVSNSKLIRVFEIEESCDEYSHTNKREAIKVKAFLNFIYDILYKRPEIKNRPLSDIMYL